LQRFDDVVSILRKEEETSTLASVVVFLASVCFENLISVCLGIKRLDNVKLRQPILVPYETKHI
jgi:hypothetical protein